MAWQADFFEIALIGLGRALLCYFGFGATWGEYRVGLGNKSPMEFMAVIVPQLWLAPTLVQQHGTFMA